VENNTETEAAALLLLRGFEEPASGSRIGPTPVLSGSINR
jgi:hypothetical protein